jgi:hypothetical protein
MNQDVLILSRRPIEFLPERCKTTQLADAFAIYTLLYNPCLRYVITFKQEGRSDIAKFFDDGFHEDIKNGLPVWRIGSRANPGMETLSHSISANDLHTVRLIGVKLIEVESTENLLEIINLLKLIAHYRTAPTLPILDRHQIEGNAAIHLGTYALEELDKYAYPLS